MNLKHINAKRRWDKYHKRRIQIVEIYNSASEGHSEKATLDHSRLTDTELLHCFYDSDTAGGVLVEQLLGNEKCALITFAGVEVKHRHRGIGTKLIRFAEKEMARMGVKIVGVQVNDFDDKVFWERRGFSIEVPHQDVTVLLKKKA